MTNDKISDEVSQTVYGVTYNVTHAKLATALAKFQADIPAPKKSGDNPHFKSKYAPLDVTTPLITKKLSQVGIAWTAAGGYIDGQYGVIGSLIHESGERLDGFFPVIATDPQKIGSAFTYGRRYLLEALTGVAPEDQDDDGQAAQEDAERQRAEKRQVQQQAAAQDAIAPLKAQIQTLLTAKGELTEDMTPEAVGAKVKALGDAYFGRAGWSSAEKALEKWINDEAYWTVNPETGEVK